MVVVTEVVGVVEQLAPAHASQQLGWLPTQAAPPLGALQTAALFFTPHVRVPFAVVRQQVTKPGPPQVDVTAHFLTGPLQDLGSVPSFTARRTTPAAHFTYLLWLVALAQGHCAAICARVTVAAWASPHPGTPPPSVVVVVVVTVVVVGAAQEPAKEPMSAASFVGAGQARMTLDPDLVRLWAPSPAALGVTSAPVLMGPL